MKSSITFFRAIFTTFILLTFLFSQPGTVVNQFPSPVSNPADLAWDGQYLYLLSLTDHIIYRLNPANGNVLGTIPTGISGALGLTHVNGHLWLSVISDHTIKKLDASGNVMKSIPIPAQQNIGMGWDGQYLWIADSGAPNEKLLQVDTLGNLISSFLFPGDSPFGLTCDDHSVWCANNMLGGLAWIYQFDPQTGAIITSFPCPGGGGAANGMTWDGQYLWIAENNTDQIYQVVGNPLPQYGVITGMVQDSLTGEGIGLVPVLNTFTDTSGYFIADSLPPGNYSFTVQADGYLPEPQYLVQLPAGDTVQVTFLLNPVGDPFQILLEESDGDLWRLNTYRDSLWRHYHIPLGRFKGSGQQFLDSPVTLFYLKPIGGGPVGPIQIEVSDWMDVIVLGDTLIDDFEDCDLLDWSMVIAYNGSYLEPSISSDTPDSSLCSLQMRHGNHIIYDFEGYMMKSLGTGLIFTQWDTLSFWLKGMKYPITGVTAPENLVATTPILYQNYPNPFNQGTWITFYISKAGEVELEILDVLGRIIQSMRWNELSPGRHRIFWNGKNEQGEELSSGLYLIRLKTIGYTLTRKMVLLR